MTISKLSPENLWQNFAAICAIPHVSHNEARLSCYLVNFGKKLKLPTNADKAGNVIIVKPATSGMEKCKTVILQSHMDMVGQKTATSKHDFAKDPILAHQDGKWVKAKNTTLGADNGIGVAAMMAILQAEDIAHGPLTAIFTVNEEQGFTGVKALSSKYLQGDYLLNLDGGGEGVVCIGCAGGVISTAQFKIDKINSCANSITYTINISGLKGGHSGADIHLNLGNANKILNQVLYELNKKFAIQLAAINGGNWVSAIPRSANAVICISEIYQVAFTEYIAQLNNKLKNQFSSEPDINISCEKTKLAKLVFSHRYQEKLINSVYKYHNGVIAMSKIMPGLVATSTNLGLITTANDMVTLKALHRSSSSQSLGKTKAKFAQVFKDAKVTHDDSYPPWQPNPKSQLVEVACKVYKEKFNKKLIITAVHAGLEPGIIAEIQPSLEMISLGPNIIAMHSPEEKVEIKSVTRFWEFLLEILKHLCSNYSD